MPAPGHTESLPRRRGDSQRDTAMLHRWAKTKFASVLNGNYGKSKKPKNEIL